LSSLKVFLFERDSFNDEHMSDALQYSRKDLRHALSMSAGEQERSVYIVYIVASSIPTVYESISSLKGPRGRAWGYSPANAPRPL
jgi:hypothetical protein